MYTNGWVCRNLKPLSLGLCGKIFSHFLYRDTSLASVTAESTPIIYTRSVAAAPHISISRCRREQPNGYTSENLNDAFILRNGFSDKVSPRRSPIDLCVKCYLACKCASRGAPSRYLIYNRCAIYRRIAIYAFYNQPRTSCHSVRHTHTYTRVRTTIENLAGQYVLL